MRSAVRIALVVAAIVVLPATTACERKVSVSVGSTPESTSSTAVASGMTAYTNDQYGFALQYPERLTETASTSSGISTGAGSVFDVAFVDTKGSQAGGSGRDLIQVSVYDLGEEITPELIPQFRDSLESSLQQLVDTSAGTTVGALEEVTVNGIPGYKTAVIMQSKGTTLDADWYFLVKGSYEYQVTLQSAAAAWSKNQPDYEQAVQTFTVK